MCIGNINYKRFQSKSVVNISTLFIHDMFSIFFSGIQYYALFIMLNLKLKKQKQNSNLTKEFFINIIHYCINYHIGLI